ncbi:hypothetical protein [Cohnella candidum]|uniref:Uncharacterized protein n=1 Tax=Cohnella candidum TaxID=2674991 RepID=A0A3G3K3E7_9BACL|nr:hypothetical protein [Cohnella candidum]AYQ74900.1 hypothetical protein EAV92_21495 [Cohnella candidum]
MKKAEKEFSKRIVEWLVYICLALSGSILIITGFLIKSNVGQNVLVSIGTSFIATAVIYFIVNLVLGDPFSPILDKLRGSIEILERANKTGLISIWKHRADVHDSHWIEKIKSSKERLDFLGYAMAFLPEHPHFVELLEKKH